MSKADSIEQDLAKLDAPKDSKKLTLAAKKDHEETSKDRAARFFATHGMMDMGKLLGDQMSDEAAKKAQEEAAQEQSKMNQIKGNVIEIAGTHVSSVPSMASDTSSVDDIPLDDEDDMKQ